MNGDLPSSSAHVPAGLAEHEHERRQDQRTERTRKVGLVVLLLMAPGFVLSPLWLSMRTKRKRTCSSFEQRCMDSCERTLRQVRLPSRALAACVEQCLPATCH